VFIINSSNPVELYSEKIELFTLAVIRAVEFLIERVKKVGKCYPIIVN
jgi:hypothetical protein